MINYFKKILFIGDSCCTETLRTYLEKDLKQSFTPESFPIHRLGFPGGGLEHILPPTKKWLKKAPATLIIHIFPDCDAQRHWRLLKRIFFLNSLFLSVKGFGLMKRIMQKTSKVSPQLAKFLEKVLRSTIFSEYPYSEGIKKNIKLINDFIQFIESKGHFYILGFWDSEDYGLKHKFIKELNQLNTKSSLILTDYNKYLSLYHPDEFIIPNDGHPNALAEQIFSFYIAKEINKKINIFN